MPTAAELVESLTGRPLVPAVDYSKAAPAYLVRSLITDRPVETVQADALDVARKAEQTRTSGLFAGDAVSRFAERAMGGFRPGGESTSEFLGREVVPLAKGRLEERYREAKGRYDKAQASDEDLGLIVRYEAIRKTEEEESTGKGIMRAAAGVPKILLEASAGGRVVGAAKLALLGRGSSAGLAEAAAAAEATGAKVYIEGAKRGLRAAPGALATGAAATPLIPDLYYTDAQMRATKNGGKWYDSQNITPAAAYAVLQSAVLGHAQRVAGGATPTVLGRAGVGGVVGFAEQQAGDSAASLVDDFLIANDAYKVGAKYGALAKAIRGEKGAEKELAAQVFTFALFSALQGPKPTRTAPAGATDPTGAPPPPVSSPAGVTSPHLPRLAEALDKSMAAARSKVIPKEKAAAELKSVGDRWVKMLAADPATAWDQARELYREEQGAKGERWTRPYERAVVETVLRAKAAAPTAPEPAAAPEPPAAKPAKKAKAEPPADPYAAWSDADLAGFAQALTGSKAGKRSAAAQALREAGVTPDVLAKFQPRPAGPSAPPATRQGWEYDANRPAKFDLMGVVEKAVAEEAFVDSATPAERQRGEGKVKSTILYLRTPSGKVETIIARPDIGQEIVGQEVTIGAGTDLFDRLTALSIRRRSPVAQDAPGVTIAPESPVARPAGGVAAGEARGVPPGPEPTPEPPVIGDKAAHDRAVLEANEAVKRGESPVYVSMDVDNMAGLVRAGGPEAATAHVRDMVGIVREELAKVGARVEAFRHAADPKGDEHAAVVYGADKAAVNAALDRAAERIKKFNDDSGVGDIPHVKLGRPKGVGLTTSAETFRADKPVVAEAEAGVEARKETPDRPRTLTQRVNVGQTQRQPAPAAMQGLAKRSAADPGSSGVVPATPEGVGVENLAVLREAGYSEEQITRFGRDGTAVDHAQVARRLKDETDIKTGAVEASADPGFWRDRLAGMSEIGPFVKSGRFEMPAGKPRFEIMPKGRRTDEPYLRSKALSLFEWADSEGMTRQDAIDSLRQEIAEGKVRDSEDPRLWRPDLLAYLEGDRPAGAAPVMKGLKAAEPAVDPDDPIPVRADPGEGAPEPPAMKGIKKKPPAKERTVIGDLVRGGGLNLRSLASLGVDVAALKESFGPKGPPKGLFKNKGGRAPEDVAPELRRSGDLAAEEPTDKNLGDEFVELLTEGRKAADQPIGAWRAIDAAAEADAAKRADEQRGAVDDFLKTEPELTDVQRRVLDLRRQGLSFKEVGEELGVTRQRVQQIEKSALEAEGKVQSIEKGEHEPSREAAAERLRKKGRRVTAAELSGQYDAETGLKLPRARAGESATSLRLRAIDDEITATTDRFLEVAERAERTGSEADEIDVLTARVEALNREAGNLRRQIEEAERESGGDEAEAAEELAAPTAEQRTAPPVSGLPEPPLRSPQVGGIPGIPGSFPGLGTGGTPQTFAHARADVSAKRAERGLPPVAAAHRRANAQAWGEALQTDRADPQAVERLIGRVEGGHAPDPNGPEVALLLLHRVRLANARHRANDDLVRSQTQTWDGEKFVAGSDPVEVERLRTRKDEIERQMGRLDGAVAGVGTKFGRGLAFFRQLANEDYTLGGMLSAAEAEAGRPLKPEERAKVSEQFDKIAAATQAEATAAEAGSAAVSRGLAKPTGEIGDMADLRIAAKKAKAEYADTLSAFRSGRRSAPRRAASRVLEGANVFRVLQTAFDLSGLFRQGGFMAAAHPFRTFAAVPDMLRAAVSERAFNRQQDAIEQRGNFPLYQKSGLFLADIAGPPTRQEEAFAGRWVKRIPGVKASERAYVALLNRVRADSFDALTAGLAEGGKPTDAEARTLAHFVNVATGRGTLGQAEPAAGALANVFFSPRYVASRLQLLAGQPGWGGTWRTRGKVLEEYGRAAAGVAAFYGLVSLLNDDERITFDPRSADFGKVRFGNTRIDPLFGLAQLTTFGTRAVTGETATPEGKASDLRGETFGLRKKLPKAGSDTGDVILRFLRAKLAPVPSTVVDLLAGKDVVGKPVTPQSAGAKLVTPFGPEEAVKAMMDQGMPRGAALALLAILGMGAQVYEPRQKAG